MRRRGPQPGAELEPIHKPAWDSRRIKLTPDVVAELVFAFRSMLSIDPDILRALEMALPAVSEPLRSLVKEELARYLAGESRRLFGDVPEEVDQNGYIRQLAILLSAPGVTREGLLAALQQLEERLRMQLLQQSRR